MLTNKPVRYIVLVLLLVFATIIPAEAQDKIRVGILPVVDTLPLLVGRDKGFFDREGIMLELIPFQSALERDAALQAGKLEGYFGDIVNTVLLIRADEKLRIITTVYKSHPDQRMFGLVSSPNSGIGQLSELKGREVAISRATVIEYLLDRLLAAENLPPDFVIRKDIKKMPIRVQMLLTDKIDSALLPEPLLTLAESKGSKVLVHDGSLKAGLTVIALDFSRLKQPETLTARFLKAYESAVKEINEAPERYKDFLVKNTRFPAPIKDRYNMPKFPEISVPTKDDIDEAQKWLIKNGLMKESLPYDEIVFEK